MAVRLKTLFLKQLTENRSNGKCLCQVTDTHRSSEIHTTQTLKLCDSAGLNQGWTHLFFTYRLTCQLIYVSMKIFVLAKSGQLFRFGFVPP